MVSPWITGAVGWALFGPLGGLLGYAAGSLLNAAARAGQLPPGTQAGPGAARNDFIASLLVLTAAMMKADGHVTKSELEVVKQFFTQQFGRGVAQQALQMLRDLLKRDIPTGPVCAQIRAHMKAIALTAGIGVGCFPWHGGRDTVPEARLFSFITRGFPWR